jgi:hypothetical protein
MCDFGVRNHLPIIILVIFIFRFGKSPTYVAFDSQPQQEAAVGGGGAGVQYVLSTTAVPYSDFLLGCDPCASPISLCSFSHNFLLFEFVPII